MYANLENRKTFRAMKSFLNHRASIMKFRWYEGRHFVRFRDFYRSF